MEIVGIKKNGLFYNVKFDNLFLYCNNCLYVEINGEFLKIKKIKSEVLEK